MTERRPIKIVIPRVEDMHPPHSGGSTKIFPTADGFVENLEKQIDRVELAFAKNFASEAALPAVAKVTLRTDAMAKSHRPTEILNQKTCPIIGSQDFGELLVRIDPNGLRQLRREIHRPAVAARAAVSTIKAIEPFVAKTAVSQKRDPRRPVKVRLVNHRNQLLNDRITA